jgi:hypothetical protein
MHGFSRSDESFGRELDVRELVAEKRGQSDQNGVASVSETKSRVARRMKALEGFEHVTVVRIIHLHKTSRRVSRPRCYSHESTHLGTSQRPDTLKPEDGSLSFLLPFIGIFAPSTSTSTFAMRSRIAVVGSRRVVGGRETESDLLGRRVELEERVAEPLRLVGVKDGVRGYATCGRRERWREKLALTFMMSF